MLCKIKNSKQSHFKLKKEAIYLGLLFLFQSLASELTVSGQKVTTFHTKNMNYNPSWSNFVEIKISFMPLRLKHHGIGVM